MQQMLEPISGLIDDPELFVKAADEIDDNIGSFPEWMGVEECCELGLSTTNCILVSLDVARDGTRGDGGAAVSRTNLQTG
jgi:hypothetical protein